MQKTTSIQSFYTRKSRLETGEWILQVTYEDVWDDPDDDDLPLTKSRSVDYRKMDVDEDGNEVLADHSAAPQLVQDICAVLWADD